MDTKLQELERRIAQLENQLATLQAQNLPASEAVATTLVAPLRIVDREGHVLATFEHDTNDMSLRLFNQRGIAVASLGIDGTQAGYLAIRNAEGKLLVLLDVEAYGARLHLEDHHQRGGVSLFGGDAGEQAGGGIHVHHSAGGVSIALWSTPAGGELTIYDGQPNESILGSMPTKPSLREDAQHIPTTDN